MPEGTRQRGRASCRRSIFDKRGQSVVSMTGDILIQGGGRNHASRTGKTRNECAPQAQHPHITMRSGHNTMFIWGRSLQHKHLYTKPASHESSFNSTNRKIGMLLPLSSPHRRLQLMIRAPEVFTSTVRVLNWFCLLLALELARAGANRMFTKICRHMAQFERKSRLLRRYRHYCSSIANLNCPSCTWGLSSAACRVLLRRMWLRRFTKLFLFIGLLYALLPTRLGLLALGLGLG